MSDNKKYYYLKIAENFFERDEMIMLESMPDGYMYSNILLKLYLRSLKNEGKLLFNNRIPYNPQMLSNITRMPVAVVEKSLSLFRELGLIELLDNGAIYMTDIQNFIGQSSTEADRKRNYRAKIEEEKQLLGQMSGQMSLECPDKTPPEIEIEKEIELDIDIDNVSKDTSVNKFTPIIEKWNSLNLQQLRTISNNRQTLLNARIKEHGFDSILEAIENINDSSFLKGQNNRNWMITFDWLVKPNNFVKVLENSYKDNTNDTKKPINNNEKSKKTKFHNFNETFTQYSPEEMDAIIRKSQREKFK
ncbi:phage replisome organizer N-terminal domain-containing protein [Metaclostridioides mangenotii]|uniref:phage replisome organizer N-terminal domain-containing protein n=1 Tax=Metaclostridioides mangenotii TaxID=1540 RepID=UPI0028E4E8F7|nr:phage replisome organizer N-terminal domain-containing protein [Clostridioides mangenotii]